MIDFNELNAMIDKVNTVITDINDDTKRNKNELENLKEVVYNVAINDILKYCDVLTKASGDCKKNIEILVSLNNGHIKFTRDRKYDYRLRKGYGVVVSDKYNIDRDYYEIVANPEQKIAYDALNHSHNSVIWFEDLCADWDNVKSIVEDGVVNGVNHILKQRAEIAHNENEKAKKNLDNFLEN